MSRAVAVLLLFSACSFSLQGPDPNRPRNEVPKCDTGKGLVVLDTLVAVGAGVATLAVLGNTAEASTALIPAAIGGVYGAGALLGNSSVNACRAEMANYETQVARRPVPVSYTHLTL